MGGTTSWTREDWCSALEERFFSERSARLPVLFFIDEQVLGDIYQAEAGEAVASVIETVRRRLGQPGNHNGYFHRIEREGRRWKLNGASGSPPFLDLLAVCVLAATRMGTGDYAPHNYYAQLRGLLTITEEGTPNGFGDSLDYLWSVYSWWLDERLEGTRGVSTVIENAPFTHIGRPLSQTLFLGSDIRRLDDFFRWIQLDPDEEVDEDVLILYFRAWAPEESLSVGANRLLQDKQFWPTLGRILGAYAQHWDGTRFDRTSTRAAALRVLVRLRRPGSVSLQALQPDGYPDRVAGGLGGAPCSAAAEDGVFVVGANDPRQLLRGGTLGDDLCRLTFSGGEVHVLQLDEELGGWASVSAFVPGERHFVLAAPSAAEQVRQQLERWSTEPVTAQRAPGPFAEWSLYGDIVLHGHEQLEGVLAGRRPTLKHRFALRGGLPLPLAGSYLSGGAPDVWLPPTTEDTLWLALDGQHISNRAEKVRLADHLSEIDATSHVVDYGGVIRRTIRMVQSLRVIPPVHDQPGHAIERDEDGQATAYRMLARIEDESAAAVVVAGPYVRGADDRWADAPVLLRRHAENAWLLGRHPGQVASVDKPAMPAWMVGQGLTGHLYEARAEFPVQYSVERWPSGEFKARARGSLPPGDLASEDGAADWVRLLLAAELAEGDPDLWLEYQAAAELLQSESGAS